MVGPKVLDCEPSGEKEGNFGHWKGRVVIGVKRDRDMFASQSTVGGLFSPHGQVQGTLVAEGEECLKFRWLMGRDRDCGRSRRG